MRLTRTVAPASLPVSLDEAKVQIPVDYEDDDELIAGLIASAVDLLDGPSGILGRAMLAQTWLLELPGPWPAQLILPLEPVISVEVSYVDGTGATEILDDTRVDLVRNPSSPVELKFVGDASLPSLGSSDWPIQIKIVAGFGDLATDVPSGIRTAIKMMVAHWYDTRSAATEHRMFLVPLAAAALLGRWRLLL